jgi:hypothetical protein
MEWKISSTVHENSNELIERIPTAVHFSSLQVSFCTILEDLLLKILYTFLGQYI